MPFDWIARDRNVMACGPCQSVPLTSDLLCIPVIEIPKRGERFSPSRIEIVMACFQTILMGDNGAPKTDVLKNGLITL